MRTDCREISAREQAWCRPPLTFVAHDPSWQPLTREQFAELERGQQLRDRRGRVWRVTTAPFEEDGLDPVILRCGDPAGRVNERFADEYMLLAVAPGVSPR